VQAERQNSDRAGEAIPAAASAEINMGADKIQSP
jgi:hypothetical protein